MKKINLSVLLLVCVCLALCKKPGVKNSATANEASKLQTAALPDHPNVLFIVVDDLRWWSINKLWQSDLDRKNDNPQPYTPNIDGLMDQSVTFTRAYSAGVECTPSRTAFLTGLAPNQTGIYRVGNDWTIGNNVTPNQTLIRRFIGANLSDPDYLVYGAGKIFHSDKQSTDWWFNRPFFATKASRPCTITPISWGGSRGYEYQILNDADEVNTWDHQAVNHCLTWMESVKNMPAGHKPFFIACGLRRPHNPLIVPQKYLSHYPIPLTWPKVLPAQMTDLPAMAKELANSNGCGNITSPNVLKSTTPNDWNKYMQEYMACVSYIDDEIGRLLTGLTNKGFDNNTIVVLISDHGVHLGEKNHIHKTTLWEETTRAPMIWKIPGLNPGTKCSVPVSLMSLYPTLVSYCGLNSPPTAVTIESLRPYLNNPATVPDDHKFAVTVMNDHAASVRGDTWRLTQYGDVRTNNEELYHEHNDPWEGVNRARVNRPDESVFNLLRPNLPSSFAAMKTPAPSCGQGSTFAAGTNPPPCDSGEEDLDD